MLKKTQDQKRNNGGERCGGRIKTHDQYNITQTVEGKKRGGGQHPITYKKNALPVGRQSKGGVTDHQTMKTEGNGHLPMNQITKIQHFNLQKEKGGSENQGAHTREKERKG